jgi:hypothetical protein
VKTLVGAILFALLPTVTARAGEVSVGPVAGYSLLEHVDTSLTHGRLRDEITLGRTWLVGAAIDLAPTPHDHVTFEFVYGPYHNDVERSCITNGATCELEPFNSVSASFLYGIQYLRSFGAAAWRPIVGGGFGIKQQEFEEDYLIDNVSATISFSAGVDATSGVRLEGRGIFVRQNAFRLDKNHFELQARVTVLFGRRP